MTLAARSFAFSARTGADCFGRAFTVRPNSTSRRMGCDRLGLSDWRSAHRTTDARIAGEVRNPISGSFPVIADFIARVPSRVLQGAAEHGRLSKFGKQCSNDAPIRLFVPNKETSEPALLSGFLNLVLGLFLLFNRSHILSPLLVSRLLFTPVVADDALILVSHDWLLHVANASDGEAFISETQRGTLAPSRMCRFRAASAFAAKSEN
jgi:hypothetical protein